MTGRVSHYLVTMTQVGRADSFISMLPMDKLRLRKVKRLGVPYPNFIRSHLG